MRTRVFTSAEIAGIVGKSKQTVDRVFQKEGIRPALRVGNTRLFDEIAVERLRLVLSLSKTCAPTRGNTNGDPQDAYAHG